MCAEMSESGFANEPLPVEGLPHLAAEHFVAVERRYSYGGLGVLAALAVVAGIGGAVLTAAAGSAVVGWLAVAAVTLLVLIAVWWVLEVRRLGYQVRSHDVSMRRGVISHKVETVPFVRVQHVRVQRGPIDRVLGLAALTVSSAGPDLRIPGLTLEGAERIKALITERAGFDEEVDTLRIGADDVVAPRPPDRPGPSVWPAPTGPGAPPSSPP